MAYFQREVSRELNRQGNRINQTFAGRYHKSLITKHHYFLNCYKYVYYNPVAAKLSGRCEDYPFSTLNGLLGRSALTIPIEEDTLFFSGETTKTLQWLNHPVEDKDRISMKRALAKREFSLRIDPSTKKENSLETEWL